MLQRFKDHAIPVQKARQLSEEELQDKIVTGVFTDRKDRPEYSDQYQHVIARAEGRE